MRLFITQFCTPYLGLDAAVLELKKRGHEIVYWVVDFNIDQSLFPGTVFHTLDDALAVRPAAGVDFGKISLLAGADWLERMSWAEPTALTLMNKKFDFLSLGERRHFFSRLVGYWRAVLKKFEPEAIIFPVAPHTIYDFVIYALAKELGLKTLMFDFTRVGDRLLLMEDFTEGCRPLQEAMRQPAIVEATRVENLKPDIAEYYKQQTNPRFDATPLDIVGLLGHFRGLNWLATKVRVVWAAIVSREFFKRFVTRLARIFSGDLKREYSRLARQPDLSRPFVYAPLHYQPENTTCPLGGVFVDQLAMIEILSAALPKGWVIYVKEHPYQWLHRGPVYFGSRYRGYYEAIAKLPNVQLIPLTTSTFELENKARAVATVTGTAGWEAILRGKPALIFGYPWYRDCPGVFRVFDQASAERIFETLQNGFKLDPKEVVRYLHYFGQFSVRGCLELYSQSISKLTPSENAVNLSRALDQALAAGGGSNEIIV